ncbi:competence protein CoiA [Azotobacter chroococcum]|nr:competence protein CoiA family protein [Azotobacter chroococcum]
MADALFFDGSSVNAADFTPEAWEGMKSASAVNPQLFTMACCGARAVLKTSIYGVQFFAHYSDECATAPETQWHVAGKDMVMGELRVLGIQGVLEKTGGAGKHKWRADIYFELPGRRVAIEIQHSYLHYRDFLRRQERYKQDGVECYWLVRQESVYPALCKTIVRNRLKNEHGNKWPMLPIQVYPAIPDMFFAILLPDRDTQIVIPGLAVQTKTLLQAIMAGNLRYNGNYWSISGA